MVITGTNPIFNRTDNNRSIQTLRFPNEGANVTTGGPSGKTLKQELFFGPSDDALTISGVGENKQVKADMGVGGDTVLIDNTGLGSNVTLIGGAGPDVVNVGPNLGGRVRLPELEGSDTIRLIGQGWKYVGAFSSSEGEYKPGVWDAESGGTAHVYRPPGENTTGDLVLVVPNGHAAPKVVEMHEKVDRPRQDFK